MRPLITRKLLIACCIPAAYGLAAAIVAWYILVTTAEHPGTIDSQQITALLTWLSVGFLAMLLSIFSLIIPMFNKIDGRIGQASARINALHGGGRELANGTDKFDLNSLEATVDALEMRLQSVESSSPKTALERNQMVAMIGHDIATPLASTAMFLQLLGCGRYGELNADVRKRVNAAAADVYRIVGLTQNLLDIEKSRFGKLRLNKATISLPELIAKASATMELYAEQEGVALSTEIGSGLVYVDEQKIVQVIINLLSNAVRHTAGHNDKPTITVEAGIQGRMLKIVVRDNGPGIAPENSQRIFEESQQLQTERPGSSGLGLYISKKIIDLHGGHIGVNSNINEGAAFWFDIPADDPSGITVEALADAPALD